MVRFTVKEGDVVEEPSDLLLLKFAQSSYGADKTLSGKIISAGLATKTELQPLPGESVVIDTQGTIIAPQRVMFLGTPPLSSFNYNKMEEFSRRAVEKIVDLGLPVRVITTTVHGTGYGLDGGEALQCLVRGFQKGLSKQQAGAIERITFLTLGKRAERMLSLALGEITNAEDTVSETVPNTRSVPKVTPIERTDCRSHITENIATSTPVSPDLSTDSKKRIFVALPFSEEFQNVYDFGIYPAVRNCGYICERVDETHFTGDVLHRIRGGIEAADLVIADLTEGRPNVYLEVGYAWGRGIPVIFVAKKDEKLHFDVSTHRCIFSTCLVR